MQVTSMLCLFNHVHGFIEIDSECIFIIHYKHHLQFANHHEQLSKHCHYSLQIIVSALRYSSLKLVSCSYPQPKQNKNKAQSTSLKKKAKEKHEVRQHQPEPQKLIPDVHAFTYQPCRSETAYPNGMFVPKTHRKPVILTPKNAKC